MVRLSLQRVVRDVRLVLPALRGRGAGGCSVCCGLRVLDRTADRRWLYRDAGGYTPKTGDLVFFDTDGDGASDHVGIVTELHGETMETVEGNVGGEVVEKRHELTDEDVFGFGALPQDEAPAGVPVMDEPENPTPAEENTDEAMDENPEEKPDEEAPDENPDEEEPEETTDEEVSELVCRLEEHEHIDTCYGAGGELLCKLEEHRHSDEC